MSSLHLWLLNTDRPFFPQFKLEVPTAVGRELTVEWEWGKGERITNIRLRTEDHQLKERLIPALSRLDQQTVDQIDKFVFLDGEVKDPLISYVLLRFSQKIRGEDQVKQKLDLLCPCFGTTVDDVKKFILNKGTSFHQHFSLATFCQDCLESMNMAYHKWSSLLNPAVKEEQEMLTGTSLAPRLMGKSRAQWVIDLDSFFENFRLQFSQKFKSDIKIEIQDLSLIERKCILKFDFLEPHKFDQLKILDTAALMIKEKFSVNLDLIVFE